MMSKTGEIRRDEMCLDFSSQKNSLRKKDKLITYSCHGSEGNQKWYFENGLLRHDSGNCIEIDPADKKLFMNECDIRNGHQIWKWKKYEITLKQTNSTTR
jgi:polypeptide N-acetylgalactosaminyltransferase